MTTWYVYEMELYREDQCWGCMLLDIDVERDIAYCKAIRKVLGTSRDPVYPRHELCPLVKCCRSLRKENKKE